MHTTKFFTLLFGLFINHLMWGQSAPRSLWQAQQGNDGIDIINPLLLFGEEIIYVNAGTSLHPFRDMVTAFNYKTGNRLWGKSYNRDGVFNPDGTPSRVAALDKEGSLYVIPIDGITSLSLDINLIKYDKSGSLLWTKPLTTASTYTLLSRILIDNQNRLVFAGEYYDRRTGLINLAYIRCIDAAGRDVWEIRWSGDEGGGIVGLVGNNYILYGDKFSKQFTPNDNLIEQSNGTNYVFGRDRSNIVAKNGDLLTGSPDKPFYGLRRYNGQGKLLWNTILDSINTGAIQSLVEDSTDQSIYAIGSTWYPVTQYRKITAKFSKEGKLLWKQLYQKSNDTLPNLGGDISVGRKYVYALGSSYIAPWPNAVSTMSIYDKQTGALQYNYIWDISTFKHVYRVLATDDGFVCLGTERQSSTIYVERYQFPTVSVSTAAPADGSYVIYPNPATHHLTIDNIDEQHFHTAELWDSNGQLVRRSPVSNSTLQWQVADLAKGTYQVVLQGAGGRLVRQVVIL